MTASQTDGSHHEDEEPISIIQANFPSLALAAVDGSLSLSSTSSVTPSNSTSATLVPTLTQPSGGLRRRPKNGSQGAIVGGAMAAVIVISVIVLLLCLSLRKKRSSAKLPVRAKVELAVLSSDPATKQRRLRQQATMTADLTAGIVSSEGEDTIESRKGSDATLFTSPPPHALPVANTNSSSAVPLVITDSGSLSTRRDRASGEYRTARGNPAHEVSYMGPPPSYTAR